jgi:hypothetical protein
MAKRKGKVGRPRKEKKPKPIVNIDNDARTAIRNTLKPKRRIADTPRAHLFPPGVSGNPDGKKPDPFSKKRLKAFTEQDFKEILDILIDQDIAMLKTIAEAKEGMSLIKIMTARVALKVLATGSAKDFELFLTRLIGKPRQMVTISGDPQAPLHTNVRASVVITIPANGKEAN